MHILGRAEESSPLINGDKVLGSRLANKNNCLYVYVYTVYIYIDIYNILIILIHDINALRGRQRI